jgi:hypothetical protein
MIHSSHTGHRNDGPIGIDRVTGSKCLVETLAPSNFARP